MRNFHNYLVLIVILLCEILLVRNVTISFLMYSFLVTGVLLSLSYQKQESGELNNSGKLLLVLMIFPIVRIVELFLSLDFFWKTELVYGLMLFLGVFYLIKFKIDIGVRKNLWLTPLVICLGMLLGFIGNVFFDFPKYSGILFLIPLIGFSEELLFRGLIQNLTEKNSGVLSSIFLTSVLYGILHLSFGISLALVFFVVSLVICFVYYLTRNIILSSLMNIVIASLFLGFPQISL